MNVAVIYHFWPHYRRGVIEQLIGDDDIDYTFFSDDKDPFGAVRSLNLGEILPPSQFVRVRSKLWFTKYYLIYGLTRVALSRRYNGIVIHGDPNSPSVWWVGLLGRLAGKRVFFWTIGWLHHEGRIRGWLRDVCFGIPTGLFLYGHGARRRAIERGHAAERLHVVYNSQPTADDVEISESERKDLRSAMFEEPDRPLLVCTSRLTSQRDLPLALEAMASLQADGCPVNLLLVGEGAERQRIEELGRELGVRVHLYGECYDPVVLARLIQASDLTIAPGMVGLTAMHSLANGVPVATHSDEYFQAPEFEAVIDGYSGILFERGDVGDLCRRMISWFRQCPPREILAQRCREVIRKYYNPEHQAKIFANALKGGCASDDGWSEFVESRRLIGRDEGTR